MLSWIKLQYLRTMQERLIFKPSHGKVAPLQAPTAYGFATMQETTITTADNVTLAVWHQPSQTAKPTILFWHGNTGHIADVGTPKKGEDYHSDYRLRLLRALLDAGYGVVHVQPRGYGNSDRVIPSEIGMWHDARAANDFCINTLGISSEKLAPLGESLGCCHALMSAADLHQRHQPCTFTTLIAPFHSILEKITKAEPNLEIEKLQDALRHPLDNSVFLDALHDSTHVLLITPEEDATTSPRHSDLLVKHMQASKQRHSQHILESAGHITWDANDIVTKMDEFIQTNGQ